MAAPSIFDTDNGGSDGGETGSTGSTTGTSTNPAAATTPYSVEQVIKILKDRLATGQTTVLVSKEDKDKITAILTGKTDTAATTTTSASTIFKYIGIAIALFFIVKPAKKNG